MCHAVADCFQVKERGFIREGYFADMVMLDATKKYRVGTDNILYKCGWSPLEGFEFPYSISKTMVNGNIVFQNGSLHELVKGKRLEFNR